MSELAAQLARVRVREVQVVISKDKMVPKVPKSGLWPRVTLELDGKIKRVGLTHYAEVKRSEAIIHDPFLRHGIGGKILNICGRSSNAALDKEDRSAMKKSLSLARGVITRALERAAANKGRFGKRIGAEKRSVLRKQAFFEIRRMLQSAAHMTWMEPGLVTPKMVSEIWRDLMNEKVVGSVLKS